MPRAIERRISEGYEQLSPSERKLARVVLECGGDLATYSAAELCSLAGVSKACATRFFRVLGYSGYQEARVQARKGREWGSPLQALLEEGSDLGNGIGAHLTQDVRNLTRTLQGLAPEAVSSALDLLAEAPRIWVVGFRNSYALASYAKGLLVQVKPDVRLLPAAGLTLSEDLATLAPDDLVLAIGFRRRPPLLRRLLQTCREAGARILYLTDPTASGTARLADVVLRCHSVGASVFDSYVAPMSVLNYLCAGLARRLHEEAGSRLARIESFHALMDDA